MLDLLTALIIGLAAPAAAFAESPTTTPAPADSGAGSAQPALLTPKKLKSDLEAAGFTDVKLVAEAFVVQAKTKDGNPVVMTFGPLGFSATEAIRAPAAKSPSDETSSSK